MRRDLSIDHGVHPGTGWKGASCNRCVGQVCVGRGVCGISRTEMRCEGGAPEWIGQSLVKNLP